MRQYPSIIQENNVVSVLRDIAASRSEDIRAYESLRDTKKGGRNRTGVRAIPTSAVDVVAGDLLDDEVNDDIYRYTLTKLSTGFYWDRQELNVSVPWV